MDQKSPTSAAVGGQIIVIVWGVLAIKRPGLHMLGSLLPLLAPSNSIVPRTTEEDDAASLCGPVVHDQNDCKGQHSSHEARSAMCYTTPFYMGPSDT